MGATAEGKAPEAAEVIPGESPAARPGAQECKRKRKAKIVKIRDTKTGIMKE